jgi:hypothetical protein
MAVPGAVTRRAERDAADLREQGIDPLSGAPIAVQTGEPSAPAPTTPTAPAPLDDVAALRARNAELEQEARTQSGRASAASTELEEVKRQLEIVNGNRSFLEGKLTEITDRVGQLETENTTIKQQTTASAVDKAVADLNGEGPTEEMLKAFEPDAVELMRRITNQRLAAVIGPVVERLKAMESMLGRLKELDKLPKLEEAVNVTQIDAGRNRELEFMRKEILPHFPDFETVRSSAAWKDYLGQDIPGRGIKRGHLLHTYRQMSDASGIRSVLTGFYNQRDKPGLDSLVVPDKTNADVPTSSAPVKIKASEYKQKLRDFTSKKLPKPEWEAFRAKWDAAISSGNVEMDVEIR